MPVAFATGPTRLPPATPMPGRRAPSDTAAELVTVIDQQLDLLADLAGKVDGNSRTVTELERYLREQRPDASNPGELAELAGKLDRQSQAIAGLEKQLHGEPVVAADPIDRAKVRQIWFSAFIISGLAWFAIIVATGLIARNFLMP